MKRWILLLLVLALIGAGALAQEQRAPILLMCSYQQVGWGNNARAVFLDENGTIWEWNGEWTEFLTDEENLAFLQATPDAIAKGQLEQERLSELRSLIACCQAQPMEALPYVASDYGAICYTAVRCGADGAAELIPLALAGDDNRENPEINAHALHLAMVELGIAIDAESFPPTPFPRQSLSAFCGYPEDVFEGASLRAVYMDCEAGPMEQELTEEQERELLERLSGLEVTGKQSCYAITSSTVYQLVSPAGETLASFEFYGANELAMQDGVYSVERVQQ